MQVKITWYEGSVVKDCDASESSVFHAVGEVLPDLAIPNQLDIKTPIGDARFTVGKRGSFIKNGQRCPSMYVVEEYNTIQLSSDSYPDAYLTCINPESNNYKFYWLRPSMHGIQATYGRIGSERGEMFGIKDLQTPYPTYMYWIRYYEKLSKGYIDQTHIYLKEKFSAKEKTSSVPKKDTPSSFLYHQLLSYAKHVVETSLVSASVTLEQVKEAKKHFYQMGQRKTVKGFNNQLMKIMQVCPRKCRYVSELLAQSTKDFATIIQREEDLILAMESVVTGQPSKQLEDAFQRSGIEVYLATEKQKEEVLSHLNDSLKNKVKTVYRVIPQKQQKRFNEYLKKEHIRKVKQLWHGSRNCNWLSIIENGLLLNPNAQITGKMFGNGIYFAPSAMKSWGYTSSNGARWAGGNDPTVFMGLYATAYGNPLDVQTAYRYTESIVKNSNANCVHAHAGSQLYNDEIIYYNEDAMVLNYIVEFVA